jgi:hypothetical protein
VTTFGSSRTQGRTGRDARSNNTRIGKTPSESGRCAVSILGYGLSLAHPRDIELNAVDGAG